MAKYFIPHIFKDGFRLLIGLDFKSIQEIGTRMADFHPSKGPNDFHEHMKVLNISGINEISRTIYSFANLLLDHQASHKVIAEGLLNAYISESEDTKRIKNPNEIISNLIFIFENAKSVKLSYKGLTLMLDVPAIYRESSIITDIRLVFNEDLEEKNRSAIITQQLKLIYSDNENEKSFYLSLDKSDLEDLKLQIERALKKEAIMRTDYFETFTFLTVLE